jgi:hypothetical protein
MSAHLPADLGRRIREALTDPWRVIEILGIAEGAVREGRAPRILCPAHDEATPSCQVGLGKRGTLRVHCFACDLKGDALALIAAARGLSIKRDYAAVLRAGAELAGIPLDGRPAPLRPAPTPRPRPASSYTSGYPPKSDVEAVWRAARGVGADAEVASLLESRGLDPLLVEELDLARAVQPDASLPPWTTYKGRSWARTGHRLILPTYDHEGRMRNLRAWRVCEGDTPKRIVCRRAAGLVLADGIARQVLELGAAPAWWDDGQLRVLIVEGEPDFLTWATRFGACSGLEYAPAIIGVLSGAWTKEIAARIPEGAIVIVRTHHDRAGDAYAEIVRATLTGKATCLRPRAA